jgi:hypothetical protein
VATTLGRHIETTFTQLTGGTDRRSPETTAHFIEGIAERFVLHLTSSRDRDGLRFDVIRRLLDAKT